MYSPGGKSTEQELQEISAALRLGESDPRWVQLTPEWMQGTTVAGAPPTPAFQIGDVDQYNFGFTLPPGWIAGSPIIPRVVWSPLDVLTGTVNWSLEYVLGVVGLAALASVTLTAGANALGVVALTEFPFIATAVYSGASFVCALRRPADTYANSVQMLSLRLMTQARSIGESRL